MTTWVFCSLTDWSQKERKDRRLIAVGSGFNRKNSRSKQSAKLLTYGLTNFDTIKLFK